MCLSKWLGGGRGWWFLAGQDRQRCSAAPGTIRAARVDSLEAGAGLGLGAGAGDAAGEGEGLALGAGEDTGEGLEAKGQPGLHTVDAGQSQTLVTELKIRPLEHGWTVATPLEHCRKVPQVASKGLA